MPARTRREVVAPAKLRHHGLIEVPFGAKRGGIYWLRLYDLESGNTVAVISEVPGNPSWSVTNAISRIIAHVVGAFHLAEDKIAVFEIWPRGAPGHGRAAVQKVSTSGGQPRWRSVSRKSAERSIGSRLMPLPGHEDLYQQVVALGGGTSQELLQDVFEAKSVVELPPPHGLFRCQVYRQWLRTQGEPDDEEANPGERFIASVSSAEVESCTWHKADWKAIADHSVRILGELGQQDHLAYAAAAAKANLPSKERRWLVSLFEDPINIIGGGYTNGQHRGCALRFSGATHGAVVVDELELGRISTDWRYDGDG